MFSSNIINEIKYEYMERYLEYNMNHWKLVANKTATKDKILEL